MDVYTTREAAALLGVQAATVTRYIARRQIATIKRGGHHFIPAAELARFAGARQVGPGWPKGRPRGKQLPHD